jgi:hypothetical protein
MAKSLGQLEVLGANIEDLAGRGAREKVMQGQETLTEKSKPEVIAEWVRGAMERLDAAVDQPAREKIMLHCGHNCAAVNSRPLDSAKKRRAKHKTLDDFIAAEIAKPPSGMRLEREGDIVYQFYTPQSYSHPMRCYCGLLRALPQDEVISKTYCQCSRGFVQKWWQGILRREVEVDLLETAVSGASECKFAIHLK